MVLQEAKGLSEGNSLATGKAEETGMKQALCIWGCGGGGVQWMEGHKRNSRIRGTVEVGGGAMRREG